VATRHILSTEIRQAFVPFLGDLLDENLLLGAGYTSHFVLRPLALSMLADLVHHVRAEIPLTVLQRIIQLYSQALHDPTLPVGVQTMSAKLLVNLTDSLLVESLGGIGERRAVLMSVLAFLHGKEHSGRRWFRTTGHGCARKGLQGKEHVLQTSNQRFQQELEVFKK